MKQKPKPMFTPIKMLLAGLGVLLFVLIIAVLICKPNPVQYNQTATITPQPTHTNLLGGPVVVSPGHPTDEESFNNMKETAPNAS